MGVAATAAMAASMPCGVMVAIGEATFTRATDATGGGGGGAGGNGGEGGGGGEEIADESSAAPEDTAGEPARESAALIAAGASAAASAASAADTVPDAVIPTEVVKVTVAETGVASVIVSWMARAALDGANLMYMCMVKAPAGLFVENSLQPVVR